MRALLWTACLTTLGLGLVPPVGAQTSYDTGRQAWHDRNYRVAHDTLLSYRQDPYGRRPDVDFMLGTSGCRLGDRRTWGANVLDWMLYAYALTHESREIVTSERDLCRGTTVAGQIETEIESIVEERAAGMTGYGKAFYWAARESQPVASYPIRRSRDIPKAKLTERRIPLSEPARALSMAATLSPDGKAEVHGHVLLVSEAGHESKDLASIGRTLDRYLRFLATTYDVQPPDHFLNVYLVRGRGEVRQLADRLHGLDVSPATVGYAFVDDASVIGAVETTAVGTILHEMFHLLVRADFGDIPQWLDEGIASLYEVSGRSGDRYFGLDNWRREVLEDLWDKRPSVEELIRTEWFLFDDPAQADAMAPGGLDPEFFFDDERGKRQAAMMAMARYFVLYLEQRDELVPVFRALRDRGFAEMQGDARGHAVALIRETLGRLPAQLDDEFAAWFYSDAARRARAARKVLTSGGSLYAATTDVNIRTGRGTEFNRVGFLRKNERVAVFSEKGGWCEVRFNDEAEGWVSGKYLKPVADPSAE